tara:strand:- start:816 stop:1094 length:279 start_codon:yes stop_codon:yes gene_type:complete
MSSFTQTITNPSSTYSHNSGELSSTYSHSFEELDSTYTFSSGELSSTYIQTIINPSTSFDSLTLITTLQNVFWQDFDDVNWENVNFSFEDMG